MVGKRKELEMKIRDLIVEHGGEVTAFGKTKHEHRFVEWTIGPKRQKAYFAHTFGARGRTFQNTVAMIRRMCREMTQ